MQSLTMLDSRYRADITRRSLMYNILSVCFFLVDTISQFLVQVITFVALLFVWRTTCVSAVSAVYLGAVSFLLAFGTGNSCVVEPANVPVGGLFFVVCASVAVRQLLGKPSWYRLSLPSVLALLFGS